MKTCLSNEKTKIRHLIFKIGDLIEEHCRSCPNVNKEHLEFCQGCFVYEDLRKLGDELDHEMEIKKAKTLDEILSSGQDMTTKQLKALVKVHGISKRRIRKALKMNRDTFYEMLGNLDLLNSTAAKKKQKEQKNLLNTKKS